MIRRQCLWFCEPFRLDIREEPLPPPKEDEICVQNIYSAISPGTELLFYRGQIPSNMVADTSIQALQQPMTYPLPYGYASVGKIVDIGAGLPETYLGQLVFAFQPHASHFVSPIDSVHFVPPDVTPEDAVFLANMETAVSFVMDGQPMIGERALIFGQGVVGLLCTRLLSQFPLEEIACIDSHPLRRTQAQRWGAHQTFHPQAILPKDRDICFELSGNPKALNQAIECTGYHGRIVVGSWYGNKPVQLDLGGAYHRSQIRLIASQVSNIQPQWRGRWSSSRRLEVAWSMLKKYSPHQLITHRFAFKNSTQAYEMLDAYPQDIIQPILVHNQPHTQG